MKDPLITRADLPAFKELILSYQQWRKARGMPESTWWNEKLRKSLEAEGLLKPRAESVADTPPSGGVG